MPEDVAEGGAVEAAFELGDLVLCVFAEADEVFRQVLDAEEFARAVHQVVSHVVGLPEFVSAADAVVKDAAEVLVTVVAGEGRCLCDFGSRQGFADGKVYMTLVLAYAGHDAVEIFLRFLYVRGFAAHEDLACLAAVAGLDFVGDAHGHYV